jgi:hypothetical protein
VAPGETLVTISSSWTSESTFYQRPELYRELPRSAKVAAVLHPNIWAAHSEWQVRSWLAGSEVTVIPPEEGWRATMIASDVVVGDFGSTTQYAAAIGARVLLATCPDVRDGSLADALRRAVPMYAGDIAEAVAVAGFADLVSSRLDQAGVILRATMYRLLGLPEPVHAVPVSPCSLTTA